VRRLLSGVECSEPEVLGIALIQHVVAGVDAEALRRRKNDLPAKAMAMRNSSHALLVQARRHGVPRVLVSAVHTCARRWLDFPPGPVGA
jgi:hypothetical protein